MECPSAFSIRGSNGVKPAKLQNLKEFAMTGFAFSIQGRIARIVFNRPDEQNLLSRDLLLALRTITSDLASNPEIQVLTLTAEGTECFSTGILTPALPNSPLPATSGSLAIMSASRRRRQNGADFPVRVRRSGFQISWAPLERSNCFARVVKSTRLKWKDTVWSNLWFRETAFTQKWMLLQKPLQATDLWQRGERSAS